MHVAPYITMEMGRQVSCAYWLNLLCLNLSRLGLHPECLCPVLLIEFQFILYYHSEPLLNLFWSQRFPN